MACCDDGGGGGGRGGGGGGGGGDPLPCCEWAVASGAEGSVSSPDETGTVATACCWCPECPASCDDIDACTTNDHCYRDCDGAYCVHWSLTCNDNKKCTNDSCDPDAGCVFEPKNCNDGDVCTSDSCNPSTGACVNTLLCSPDKCCPVGTDLFCCGPGEDLCCPTNPAYANHCCYPGQTCCGAGCCESDETCCNGVCAFKGACCKFDTGSCSEETHFCCDQQGGSYQGDGTTCSPADKCRPRCENCRTVSAVFYECSHSSGSDACSTTYCIENAIDTATCDFFPYRLGEPNCDTKTLPNVPWVVQRVRLLLDASCANYWPGDYHERMPLFNFGCQTTCDPWDGPIRTRCDTFDCLGALASTQPRIPGYGCGCP